VASRKPNEERKSPSWLSARDDFAAESRRESLFALECTLVLFLHERQSKRDEEVLPLPLAHSEQPDFCARPGWGEGEDGGEGIKLQNCYALSSASLTVWNKINILLKAGVL
jgi:hypothetical protein